MCEQSHVAQLCAILLLSIRLPSLGFTYSKERSCLWGNPYSIEINLQHGNDKKEILCGFVKNDDVEDEVLSLPQSAEGSTEIKRDL